MRGRSAGALLLVALGSRATAQPLAYTPLALDPFVAAARGSDWFVLDSLDFGAATRGKLLPRVGLTTGYALQPVVIPANTADFRGVLVAHQVTAQIGASLVVLRRLRVELNLPLFLYNGGAPARQNEVVYPAPDAFAIGDLRVGADLRLFGRERGPITGAIGLAAFAPTGSRSDFGRGGGPLGELHMLFAGQLGPVAWALRVGVERRGVEDLAYAGARLDFELGFGAAVGLRLLDRRLLIGPELYGRTNLGSDRGFQLLSTPLEVLLGARLRVHRNLFLAAGVGRRLTDGLGAADVRGVLALEWRYAPEPTEQMVVVPEGGRAIGGIEIDDGKQVTLLDRPYAAVAVARDGKARPATVALKDLEREFGDVLHALPPPPPDRDHDGIGDASDACPDVPGVVAGDPARRGCPPSVAAPPPPPPPSDRDGDKILDADDACPELPGIADADRARNGCPKAVERMVVLPGLDGQVGAIAVTGKGDPIVLDRAYAAVEVDEAGHGRSVSSSAAEVQRLFGAAIAARPPVVPRVTIYFDEKERPSTPLDGLIAEILDVTRGRASFRVFVVGHSDRVGDRAANLKLGLSRARFAADRLIAAGIPKRIIKISSRGEAEPAVATADEVYEPRNRRVEVTVK